MASNLGSFDQIATATHVTDGTGRITGVLASDQITLANNNNKNPLLLVGNNFDGNIAKTLLEGQINRQNFINNLLTIIRANNYKGVNIDFEGVFSSDRTYFTTFISEVYNTLKPLGYTTSISVPAKTADSSAYTWNYAYDYASIAKYADQVIIMAYDEHYPGGSPGPVASIGWVTNVVTYAVKVIPKEKIYLGVSAYGYDWWGTSTKAYSINGCYNLASINGSSILWDAISKTPYFQYKDTAGLSHSVWFENAESLGYKLDLVNNSGIGGIAIWRLGLENTDYWSKIRIKFGR